jgi:asparagine synthase (glutamine-hydrolysing)
MSDAAQDHWIVFNGEIYNFAELREELSRKGHRFRTRSDTEVILEGYRAWGTDVVKRLRGMFAIALYDGPRDRLVLMRDRIGKKPLAYAFAGPVLAFGSEIKSVLAFPGIERKPDMAALDAYLTYQYVPADMCAFAGISKLPMAHIAVIERNGALRLERYWSLPEPSAVKPRPDRDVTVELVDRLAEATRVRLVSDVPLGAFLSGGVDSSAVVAMMAKASPSPVRTFTIGFDRASHDERRYARMVAERYGTRHEEMEVRADAASILDDLVYHYDEPFADASAVPTYFVSKIAREHVTVVLSGDGGDENFLGYERYRGFQTLDRVSRLPRPLITAMSALARALPASADRLQVLRRARRALARATATPAQRYAPFIAYFDDDAKQELYAPALAGFLARSALDRLAPYLAASSFPPMAAAWADVHTYLPDDILVKVDIASMANSLEARAPFLDHKLMEWAATLPGPQRNAGGEPKSLLKRALEPHLPRELLYRPKMGFGLPVDDWIAGPLESRISDALLGSKLRDRGLFRTVAIEEILKRHRAGQSQGYRIWALLMLELWFRQWIDAADAFDTPAAQRIMARYAATKTLSPEVGGAIQ